MPEGSVGLLFHYTNRRGYNGDSIEPDLVLSGAPASSS
jgi:hypothetical protein